MLQPRICLHRCRAFRHPSYLLPFTRRSYATMTEIASGSDTDKPPPSDVVDVFSSPVEPVRMRTYKPRTPGVRHLKRPINDHLYMGGPHRPLTFPRKGHGIGGRNYTGQITMRHRGGGHKRRIRVVDFDRMESGKWFVERIERDPGRSAHIALISRPQQRDDEDSDPRHASHTMSPIDAITRVRQLPKGREYRYIIAAKGMRAGELIESFRKGVPQKLLDELGGSADAGMIAAKTAWRGNCLPLHMIPTGTIVYNVGLYKGKKAQLCRSAGTFAMVVNKNDESERTAKFVDVRLQSGEVRKIHRDACATVGVASNPNHHRAQLGKAGRSRWLGIRPTVRGVAMNACDHPHGGGRGKSKGNRISSTIWGQLAKGGYKTRKRSNVNKYVVSPRPRSVKKAIRADKKKKEKKK